MEWLKISQRLKFGWLRNFLLLIILVIGVIFGNLMNPQTALAADASWKGQSLKYGDSSYTPFNDENKIKKMGLDSGGHVYAVISGSGSKQQVKVIYFSPESDMINATSAEYIIYDFKSPDKFTKVSSTKISVEAMGDRSDATTGDCGVESVGWAVCPATTFLARGMDWIYSGLDGFLEAQPLNVSNTDSGLYLAWNMMLGFANMAFIVGFLVIIYSQITSAGISNYGVKRMLPRLIIAAVAVNLSYYICAIAIDLSNITGHALQDMFMQIRNTLATLGQAQDTGQLWSWESIAELILSGGMVGGAVGVGAYSFFSTEGGVLTSATALLLPILLTLALALLVVLMVLAARQALIVILTIISPLAFVCYILPGTEKWFEKWRDTFLTMLIFFPAFSAVFGGSQLAAMVILQNAASVTMVILGLAVQVAPLAIAPLILKLSGGLLNRFAGIINNPNRGLVDRARNWSSEKSKEIANKRSLANPNLKRRNVLRRVGQYAAHRRMAVKERQERLGKDAENVYNASRLHRKENLHRRMTDARSAMLDAQDENRYEKAVAGFYPEIDRGWLEKTGRRVSSRYALNKDLAQHEFTNEAAKVAQDLAAAQLSKAGAQRVREQQLAEKFKADEGLRNTVGMVENLYYGDNRGSQRALASSIQTISSAYEDSIKNATAILNHTNFSNSELVELVSGNAQRGVMATEDIRAAAARKVFGGKDTFAIRDALEQVDFSSLSGTLAQEIGESLLTNSAKPAWVGGALSAQIKENKVTVSGEQFTKDAIVATTNAGKWSAEILTTQDLAYLKKLFENLGKPEVKSRLETDAIDSLRNEIDSAFANPQYSGRIGATNKKVLQDIRSML